MTKRNDRRSSSPPLFGNDERLDDELLDEDELDAQQFNEAQLTEALGSLGLLPPETDAEVRQAERELDADRRALPASLQHFEPRRAAPTEAQDAPQGRVVVDSPALHVEPSNVVPLHPAKSGSMALSLGRMALGFGLGAAAASVLWLGVYRSAPTAPRIGGEPAELPGPEPTVEPKLALTVNSECSACCAGARCEEAKAGLQSCPSGRTCIGCSTDAGKNAYKLRISALGLNEAGRAWALQHAPLSSLKVCAEIRGQSLGCRSAVEVPTDLVEWSSLPVATTSSQLFGGLKVNLVTDGEGAEPTTLASWSNAITLSPDTLCRGVAMRLETGTGEVIGRVSAFFDDTTFVELGRAASVNQLLELQARFKIEGDAPRIYQTSASGDRAFSLVYGPTDRARAEAIRWQLLDQQFDAPITFGEDHTGAPRPSGG